MAYEPKDGSGALFKNDKGDNPSRPDYRGDVMVGGIVYEISGWIKPLPRDASLNFLSLSAKPKQARPAATPAPAPARASNGFDDMADDIPF